VLHRAPLGCQRPPAADGRRRPSHAAPTRARTP
jgi:hypothetical protein